MVLIVYRGPSPVYIEGFPAGSERSCAGALHLIPYAGCTITNDEWAHLQSRKEIMEYCVELCLPRSSGGVASTPDPVEPPQMIVVPDFSTPPSIETTKPLGRSYWVYETEAPVVDEEEPKPHTKRRKRSED